MAKRRRKIKKDLFLVFILLLSSIYLIYNLYLLKGIETIIRILITVVIIFFNLFLITKTLTRRKTKKLTYWLKIIIMLITSIAFIFIGYNINRFYSKINKFNKKIVQEISLVTLKDNKNTSLESIDKEIIYTSNSDKNVKTLNNEFIKKYYLDKKNEIQEGDSYQELIDKLLKKEIKYAILPSNYIDIYEKDFKDLKEKTKVLANYKKIVNKEDSELVSNKKISEPFTLLLLGIDSTTDDISKLNSFNGDTLIAITFNPNTLNATVLSIPRDSYVPLGCGKRIENKITHAAHYGTNCVINTVSNFLDMKIDYYVKINFKGVVDLVNALGGIEVDVPYGLCEQNSNRAWGKSTVFIEKKGLQTLNGEQALALSRNRHTPNDGTDIGYIMKKYCPTLNEGNRSDFTRGDNQQKVIQGIINKLKTIKDLDKINQILDTTSKNIDTNMKTETILSFYNLFKEIVLASSSKDIQGLFTLDKLKIIGANQIIYDETSKLELYNYIPNKESVQQVQRAMKINLGKIEPEETKEFYFDPLVKYVKKTPGEGPFKSYNSYTLLPSFIGLSKSAALEEARKVGVTINFEEVAGKTPGIVFEQEYPKKKRVDLIPNKTMILKIGKATSEGNNPELVDCTKDSENQVCIVPNFIGKSRSLFKTWVNSFSKPTIQVSFYNEENQVINNDDLNNYNIITNQDNTQGKNVNDLTRIKITLKKVN